MPAAATERIASVVHSIRGENVILDSDLAELYSVEARALNQAVRSSFLSGGRGENSSQSVMSSRKHRGSAYLPYAFTERGVAMLSSVLRSARAIQVNIAIMRTFVELRRLMDSNRELARKAVPKRRIGLVTE